MELFILFLIFFSTLGYSICTNTFFKIPTAFAPATAIGFQVFVLYVSALAGVLQYVPIVLLIGGFVALIASVFKDKTFYKNLLTPSFMFFTVSCVLMILLAYGRVLVEYDNFSQWGPAVKDMLGTNKFQAPNALVKFSGYPYATTLWCYNAAKLASVADGVLIAAQSIAAISFLTAVFHGAEWKKPFKLVLTFLAAFAMICVIYGNLFDLYIDSMLGYASVALLFMLCMHEEKLSQYVMIFFTAFALTLIGHTGTVLVFLVFVYWLITHLKGGVKGKIYALVTCALPVALTRFSYYIYSNEVFGVNENQKLFSQEALKNKFGEGKVSVGLKGFLKVLFNYREIYVKFFFFSVILAAAILYIMCLRRKQNKARYISSLIAVSLVIVLWLLCTFLIFMTTLNEYELEHMSGFDRYFGTIIIFFVGTLIFGINDVVDEIAENKVEVLCVVLAGFLCPLWVVVQFNLFPPEWKKVDRNNKAEAREMLVAAKEQYSDVIGENDRVYCVIDGLVAEVINEPYPTYAFDSTDVLSLSSWNRDNDEWLEYGKYLLYLAPGDDTDEYFDNRFPADKMKRGLYKIEDGNIVFVKRLIQE